MFRSVDMSQLRVVVGQSDLRTPDGQEKEFAVDRVWLHEQFQ